MENPSLSTARANQSILSIVLWVLYMTMIIAQPRCQHLQSWPAFCDEPWLVCRLSCSALSGLLWLC